jgi:enamine deaminase RidA (YjgF/YER057c/UK114 family)
MSLTEGIKSFSPIKAQVKLPAQITEPFANLEGIIMTTAPVLRRNFFASAAALMAGIASAINPAAARPVQISSSKAGSGKRVVEIPKTNQLYGKSTRAFEEYKYSPAVRAGGLLFIAGVVGMHADGSIPESVAEQTDLAFQRLAELLRVDGLSMEDLVEIVSHHVDLPNTLPEVMPIKERHIVRPFPAWTILGIECLAEPKLKIEIRAVAALRA